MAAPVVMPFLLRNNLLIDAHLFPHSYATTR